MGKLKQRNKMFFKKHWRETTLFSTIAVVYSICCTKGFSWAGLDNDVFNFVFAAKFMKTPHIPGYPIHTFITMPAIRLPFGTEGWNMAFFGSTLPAILTCILVFIVVRKQVTNKWAPYIAAGGLAGCNAFLMQSVIIEVYAIAGLLLVATYTAYVFRREKTTAVLAGLTFGTHPLMIPGAALLAFLGTRRSYWWVPVTIGAGLYGYCFAANSLFFANYLPISAGIWNIIGSAPLWYLPTKLGHTAILLTCGFALALIPAMWHLKILRDSWILWGLMITPIMYWITCATPVTYVHFQMAFPVIAIAAGLGVERIKIRKEPILAASLALLLIMPFFYNVGRNLDENLSAQAYYDELSTIPDGSVILNFIVVGDELNCGIDERVTIGALVHNLDRGSKFVLIDIDKYIRLDNYGEEYRAQLRKETGLKTPVFALLVWGEATSVTQTLSYSHAHALADENPDVEFYYTIIPIYSPMDRNLTRMYPNEK